MLKYKKPIKVIIKKMVNKNRFKDIDAKVYPSFECGHNCKFCMTDMRYKPSQVSTKKWLDNFSKAIKKYHLEGGKKVLITGGEPTKSMDRVLGMLKELRKYEWDLIVLYTNGSQLFKKFTYQGKTKKIIDWLYDTGLRHLNISVHHYNNKKRQSLLDSKEKVCDISRIEKEVEKKDGMTLRLNCTLMKDFIGNKKEVLKYLNFAKNIGVIDVYFRDLFHLENRGVSMRFAEMKKVNFTDNQRIDFYKLINDMKKVPDILFQKNMSRHVGQGQTYLFDLNGMKVWFGTLEIGTEKENKFTYFSFMPDGNIYYNMNGPEYKAK
jgi:molybdenum cofactor biosynthesis enzyme MoaA